MTRARDHKAVKLDLLLDDQRDSMGLINPAPKGVEGLAGMDVEGMPPLADIARAEQSVFRRFSPARNRWPAVAEFDIKASELEARQTAGIPGQTQADVILTLLREDADWLAASCTVEQRALITGQAPDETPGATWAGSTQAVEQERDEKAAALKRHRDKWGTTPA